MSSHYQFIHDESQIQVFYDQMIKPYVGLDNHAFIVIPIVRRKYWSQLSTSCITINSRVISTKKLNFAKFLAYLKRYQIEKDLYHDSNHQPIPQHAFGLYITLNPMDEVKASFLTINDFNKQLKDNYDKKTQEFRFNHIKVYKSNLHTCPIKKYVKLDVDTKNPTLIQKLNNFLTKHQISVVLKIETKNGYHYVLPKEDQCKELHTYLKQEKKNSTTEDCWVTIEQNANIIIPGTYQGGFPTTTF